MTRAAAWRWCLAAGVAAFIGSWMLGRVPGLVACGSTNGMGPILAFELVRSPADVTALFGTDPCRATFAAAQRTGAMIDMLLFVPAYTAFLVLAAISVGLQRGWVVLVAVILILAGLLDEVEGLMMLGLLANLPGTQPAIDALSLTVHGKFVLLTAGTIGVGALLVDTRRIAAVAGGLVVLVGGGMAAVGLATLPNAMMMDGFTIAWFAVLFVALAGAVRPAWFSAAPGRSAHRR